MLGQDELEDAWGNGKKLGPNPNKQRYTCDKTGAHFEHYDMCRRIERLRQLREIDVDTFVAKALNIHTVMNQLFGQEPVSKGKQLNKELKDPQKVDQLIRKQRQIE